MQLLAELSAALESTTTRKRQRQEDGGDGDKAEQAVIDLTVLIESRYWAKIPGHAGVVASLLAILSSLLAKKHIIKDGVDYLEQEILGAILAVLEKIHVGLTAISCQTRTMN
jgi:U3 small nucleolar RNA-associated protein 10